MTKVEILITTIQDRLEEAGFKTSWRKPFWAWMHPEWKGDDAKKPHDGKTLYVSNIPLPPVPHLDFAEAKIDVHDDRIYFELTYYFHKVLEGAVEAGEIRKIHEQHDSEWFPKLQEYLLDVLTRFFLKWDIEYDESIEDALWGNFTTESVDQVVVIMEAIRQTSR